MTDTGPIVVATDLGEAGRRAVNLSLACAEGMHWPLCLVHVIDLARDAVPAVIPPAILPAVEAMQAVVRQRTELAARA